MSTLSRAAAALMLAAASAAASAAETNYAFDSISRIDVHAAHPSVTGILRNTTTPVTVTFVDQTNGEYRYVVSRCVPLLLTMLEKPGRYYLISRLTPPPPTSGS